MEYCNAAASGRYLVYALCLIGIFGAYLFFKLYKSSKAAYHKRGKQYAKKLVHHTKQNPGQLLFLPHLAFNLFRAGVYVGISLVMVIGCLLIGFGLLVAGIGNC